MSLTAVCPGCSTKVTAPDGAAGKKVRCPKCQAAVPVPAADDEFEVVDEAPAKPKKRPAVVADDDDEDDRPRKKKPAVVADDDDEDDDRPRRKKPAAIADEDDEDDRPRKKRRVDDDDEDDDRPRRKKRRRDDDEDERQGVSMTRNLIMGGVLLVLVAIAGYIFYTKTQPGDDGTPKGDGVPKVVTPGRDADKLKPAGMPGVGK